LQDRDWKRKKRKDEQFREYSKAVSKRSYEKNKDRYNKRRREQYENNPEKHIQESKKYYLKNKKEITKKSRISCKKYYNTKRGKILHLLKTQKRDSIIANVEFNLSYQDVLDILERDRVCVYCKKSEEIGLDHIIPKCKGGETIKKYLVRCCKVCNNKKGRKIYA
jgi:5-methylcytosine-specific restriction endonuclease McrA